MPTFNPPKTKILIEQPEITRKSGMLLNPEYADTTEMTVFVSEYCFDMNTKNSRPVIYGWEAQNVRLTMLFLMTDKRCNYFIPICRGITTNHVK